MVQLDYVDILNRTEIYNIIKEHLLSFQYKKKDLTYKRGIYIYGKPGCGKTEFVMKILKDIKFDVLKYDAGDIRNKSIIELIKNDNMSDKNVISLFKKVSQQITIVMDEIDGMNSGDKGGISALIKLIRPKKTKKQKTEEITYNPIICIGNYHSDKKIQELKKVCLCFELKSPTDSQIKTILLKTMPDMELCLLENVVTFLKGDLRKLESIYKIYNNHQSMLKNDIIQNILKPKIFNEDSKNITKKLLVCGFSFDNHQEYINETDRTIVGLLFHENIIDHLNKVCKKKSIPFYTQILNNVCFSDYIDRITFQKQIWQFNEMTSLLKISHNNDLYTKFKEKHKLKYNYSDIRFTKVLTKYSTEYNNQLFTQELCFKLNMDKKDLILYFINLKEIYSTEDIINLLEANDISKLDVERIYRYIETIFNIET